MLNPQLSSLIVTTEGLTKIQALLDELRSETNARCVLLVEKSGQHLAKSGVLVDDMQDQMLVMAMSALVVGAFSSTREIARFLGETEFKTMFQQGSNLNIFICLLDTQDIVTVIFDEQTTLGMIKLKSQQMTKRIGEEIKMMAESGAKGQKPWH